MHLLTDFYNSLFFEIIDMLQRIAILRHSV